MQNSRDLAPPVSGAIGYPLGFAAAVVVTLAAVAAHGTAHPQWTLAMLAVTTAAVATVTTLRAALATAAVAWALHAGFVLGRRGELVFTAASAVAAVVLTGTAVVVCTVALAIRYARRTAPAPIVIPAPRGAIRMRGRVS